MLHFLIELGISNSFDGLREISRKGKIIITVIKEKKTAVVEVLDNGPGVPEDIRKVLFQKPSSTKRDPKDPYRGLGLYLSNKLCMLMGGGIKYDYSELRQLGSRFVLYLPLTEKCDKYVGVQDANE
ncbi:MAG: ATP-binding protein [Patescibacteria group bacterium]